MEQRKYLDEFRKRYLENDILFDITRKKSRISLMEIIIFSLKNCKSIDSSSEISIMRSQIKTLKSDIQNLYNDLLHIRHALLS